MAKVIRKISVQPKADLDQLFRRLIFNLMIDNTDDHVKNHGMLHVKDGKYRLAPAFDVVMQLTNISYQAMSIVGRDANSKISTAVGASTQFGINKTSAEKIVTQILSTLSASAIDIVKQCGASAHLVQRVTRCLARQKEIIFDPN